MTLQNQTIRTITKSLLCALLLCLCLFIAGLVMERVQAASGEAGKSFQATTTEEPEAVPSDDSHKAEDTDLAGEDEASSVERPGSSDQHNSTGDDILVRVPR